VILFSLSLLLINCSNENTKTEENRIAPEEYLFILLDEWPDNLEIQIDSIASLFVENNYDFQLHNFGNHHEKNSLLITGESKSTIAFASEYFSKRSVATTHYDEYYIWSVPNKRGEVKSVSQYPHPTLKWVVEVKR
jgi:hypothetical protein